MDSVRQQYELLLRDVLDGRASDDERDEFMRLLVENPPFAEEFAAELSIHSLLQWHSEDVIGDLVATGLSGLDHGDLALQSFAGASDAKEPPVGEPLAFDSRARRWTWAWSAAAALVIVAAGLAWTSISGSRISRLAVAEIVSKEGVVWSDDSTALADQQYVVPGKLKSSSGVFTLKFRSGANVQVVGPATLDVQSDMLVGLERGQATARITEASKGFTLTTPLVNVVDQGTEFGVAIGDDGKTDVIVFEGKVDVHKNVDAAAKMTRLVQGEAVRFDPETPAAMDRLMQVRLDAKGGWWSTDHPDFSERVINEVRDNIPPSDGSRYFCYQVTFHGLEDDGFAYADHPHQWNGLTAKGLPAFLRGADYVKTFNDYRYLNDFEMTIKLSTPANLYVFFDDRVPTPAWLKDQFEDTGVDIGLDEGTHPECPDHTIGVGGGNSIDNVFSVWRRRCLDSTPVTLGPVGKTNEARAMYGIAATRLD